MMTVLLAFQFSHYDPRLENARQRLIWIISTAGPYIGFCVIVGMLWRLIWLLKHTITDLPDWLVLYKTLPGRQIRMEISRKIFERTAPSLRVVL